MELLRFACAGSAGFAADYLTVLFCVQVFMLSPYTARIFSFMAAVFTTYVINKRFTFVTRIREGSRSPGLLPYAGTMLLGLCANYGIYMAVLDILPSPAVPLQLGLLLAVGTGSLTGMSVNFLLCRRVLFKR